MNNGTKVLVFCPSGQISGALIIKWAIDTNKLFTKEIATAFVMQRRYEIKDIPAWLFIQILPFGQQKTKLRPLIEEGNEEYML